MAIGITSRGMLDASYPRRLRDAVHTDLWETRNVTRAEFDEVVEWAAREGWNPGRGDADVFWNSDPAGFIGAWLNEELIGAGSIVSYGGTFGFMGFFIIRPEFRGRGYGARLWHDRVQRLTQRLHRGAAIGMDGVFAMQPFYERGGFRFSHRSPRMEGVGRKGAIDPALAELTTLPFDTVCAFDRVHFGCERTAFLKGWIAPKHGLGLGYVRGNQILGIGVIRPCRRGFKIGPLFAETPTVAEALFTALSDHASGEPLFLDVPECNRDATALAHRHGMREVFGCARMYLGTPPEIPWSRIYGITTFELG